jgi:hypothetical protein
MSCHQVVCGTDTRSTVPTVVHAHMKPLSKQNNACLFARSRTTRSRGRLLDLSLGERTLCPRPQRQKKCSYWEQCLRARCWPRATSASAQMATNCTPFGCFPHTRRQRWMRSRECKSCRRAVPRRRSRQRHALPMTKASRGCRLDRSLDTGTDCHRLAASRNSFSRQ